MKKLFIVFLLAGVIVFGLTGCVSATTVGGTSDMHGLFSGSEARNAVTQGAQEIASYSVIMGFIDSGYRPYADAVRRAEAEGKLITTVTVTYGYFFTKITAYAQ